jgi:magnesium chelatase family protein
LESALEYLRVQGIPPDLKKDASSFDLPIALGLLVASEQLAFDRPGNHAIVGELALTGETRPIKGILSMALQAVTEGKVGLLAARANASEPDRRGRTGTMPS